MTNTNTIIVSDWHIGLSVTQYQKINKFLDNFLSGEITAGTLILNGDILDLNWEKLEVILKKYKAIMQKIVSINQLGTKIIYVLGNHDPLSPKQKEHVYKYFNGLGLNTLQITNGYQLKIKGFIYAIRHGHEFDLFIADHPFLSDMADIGYRMLIRIDNKLGMGLTQNFIYFFRKFFDYSKQLEWRVKRFIIRRPYYGIIIGHTHIPKISKWKIKKLAKIKTTKKIQYYLAEHKLPYDIHFKHYMNTGDWVEGTHCTYINIDNNGQAQLEYYK